MEVADIILSSGLTGFYLDDKHAIQKGARLDGNYYFGKAVTDGFSSIRQPGESVSVILVLDDGQIAYGDCVTGQYSGIGGRDRPFFANDLIQYINKNIKQKLIGMKIGNFRDAADVVESMTIDGARLHTGVRYGITQAILDAVSKIKKMTMAEIICQEYDLTPCNTIPPIFIQTGDDRYIGVDKGIMKRADVLPHALIKNIKDEVGNHGEKLLEYVKWIKERILKIGAKDYQPRIHLDLYGTIGKLFNQDISKVTNYLEKLKNAINPYDLQLEMPVDMGSKEATSIAFGRIKEILKKKKIKIKLVIDEWANTKEEIMEWADNGTADIVQIKTIDVGGINRIIESILYCNKKGVGSYLGGTCNETDVSARVCANIAIATNPYQILAKPGMAVDEGLMIVKNEMSRVLSIIQNKSDSS